MPLDAAIPFWIMNWLWLPAPVLAVTMLPLVFPDGHLPSAKWRPVVATTAIGASLLIAAFVIDAWPRVAWTAQDAPLVPTAMIAVGGLLVGASAVASLTALVLRWRAADALHRRQFQPAGVTAGLLALAGVATYPWQQVWAPTILVAFGALLVAYSLAVARYRLHDLDPVLGRAAVAAIVALLVAAVYAVVVVAASTFVGLAVENRVLPLVAVAAVALLIEPVRRRARLLVDRVLYRADTAPKCSPSWRPGPARRRTPMRSTSTCSGPPETSAASLTMAATWSSLREHAGQSWDLNCPPVAGPPADHLDTCHFVCLAPVARQGDWG